MSKTTIYTQPGCGACVEAKEELKRNNIDFEEKDVTNEFEKEFDDLTGIIGCWYTPTIIYKSNILVGGRDFTEAPELPFTLRACDNKQDHSVNLTTQEVILQRLKTFEYHTQETLTHIVEALQELKEKK